jgi:hypothetical protein
MAEPSGALTYNDLLTLLAEQLGVAYYGPNGDLDAAPPIDVYELGRLTRILKGGIRMFISDAPPNGWRWQRPLAEVDLWRDLGVQMPPASAGPNYLTSTFSGVATHVTSTVATFSPASVGLLLAVRDTGVFLIVSYISSTEITLAGNVSWGNAGHTFNFTDPAATVLPTMTGVWNGVALTTITADPGTFYPSSEGKSLFITNEATVRTLGNYVSDTTMTIADATGAQAWTGAKTFSLSAQGVYALPSNFGGEYCGPITYQAGSNRGVPINWTSDVEIRRLRENWNSVSGNPYYAAIRRNNTQNRRWELMVYPNTGGTYRVEFPYVIYFDDMINPTDMHIAGFQHDEAILAAILAYGEMSGEDTLSGRMDYYRKTQLPNSYRIDARSAPRRLGYVGNPRSTTVSLRDFRQYFRRPTVTYRS